MYSTSRPRYPTGASYQLWQPWCVESTFCTWSWLPVAHDAAVQRIGDSSLGGVHGGQAHHVGEEAEGVNEEHEGSQDERSFRAGAGGGWRLVVGGVLGAGGGG